MPMTHMTGDTILFHFDNYAHAVWVIPRLKARIVAQTIKIIPNFKISFASMKNLLSAVDISLHHEIATGHHVNIGTIP